MNLQTITSVFEVSIVQLVLGPNIHKMNVYQVIFVQMEQLESSVPQLVGLNKSSKKINTLLLLQSKFK